MSRHEGVSCDICMKSNFSGLRYKCLVCYDFDLCAECHEGGQSGNNHTSSHPVQCLLTRHDYDLFYGGESGSSDHPHSLTCPFCGNCGYTDSSLHEHVVNDHPHVNMEVICPVCAGIPHGDPNRTTDDLASHLAMDHISRRDTTHEEGGRGPRRLPQSTMRGTTGLPRRGRGPSAASSLAQDLVARQALSAVSSSNNGNTDPIAELLSQLGGMRRANNTSYSSTLQQIHQLQQQLGSEVPRRALVMGDGRESGTSRGTSSGEGPYEELWGYEIASASSGRPAAIILDGGRVGTETVSTPGTGGGGQGRVGKEGKLKEKTAGHTSTTSHATSSTANTEDWRLIPRLYETKLTDEEQKIFDQFKEDRAEFVADLVFESLKPEFLEIELKPSSSLYSASSSSLGADSQTPTSAANTAKPTPSSATGTKPVGEKREKREEKQGKSSTSSGQTTHSSSDVRKGTIKTQQVQSSQGRQGRVSRVPVGSGNQNPIQGSIFGNSFAKIL